MFKCGKNFDLNDNEKILKIVSPKKLTGGDLCGIVYKCMVGRWVVVAMKWKNEETGEYKPCLGVRWFFGNSGNPISRWHGTWYVIPSELSDGILSSLSCRENLESPLNPEFVKKIKEFLKAEDSEDLSCKCEKLREYLTKNRSGK